MARKKKPHKKKKSHKKIGGFNGKSTMHYATATVASGLGQVIGAAALNFGIPMMPAMLQKPGPLALPVIGWGVNGMMKAPPQGNFVTHLLIGFGGYGLKSATSNYLPGIHGIMEPDMGKIEEDIKQRLGAINIGEVEVGSVTVGGSEFAETYG